MTKIRVNIEKAIKENKNDNRETQQNTQLLGSRIEESVEQ